MSEKKVACYARTSTIEQVGGLESQVRVLRQYCDQNGITNFELFSDGGISGTKASRPALDQMMAAVDRNEISTVVVHSFSRFARSTTHLLSALTRFKEKGVHFVSISERIDTNSAVGVAIFSLTGQSIPAEQLPREFTIGITFDPSHVGPARLETA